MFAGSRFTIGKSSISAVFGVMGLVGLVFLALSAGRLNPAETQRSGERWLNVVGTVPLPGELLTDRIIIFLDGELVPPNTNDDKTASPVLTIAPAWPGDLRVGTTYIVFKPTSPPRDEIFQVNLNPSIRSTDGRKLNPRNTRLAFATFTMEPRAFWTLEEKPDGAVFGIRFPAPAALEDLERRLRVTSAGGQDVAFVLEPGGDDKTIRLILNKNAAWPVTVTIRKGLADSAGAIRTEKDYSYTYPTTTSLHVLDAVWGRYDAIVQAVVISFSKPVQKEDLARHLTIRDLSSSTTLPFELSAWGGGRLEVALRRPRPADTRISVEIARGLPGEERTVLATSYVKTLEMKATVIPLILQQTWWSSAGAAGATLVAQFNKPVEAAEMEQHLEITPTLSNLRVRPWRYGGLEITGDWEPEQSYQMQITPGLKYGMGEVLDRPLPHTFKTQRLPAYLGFSNPGKYYFPRQGGLELTLASRNLRSAQLEVHRMFPSNIAVALDAINNGDGSPNFNQAWSEKLAATSISLTAGASRLVDTPLDLPSLLPANRHGVFCLQAFADRSRAAALYDDYGQGRLWATKIILITDIGLLAHWRDDELILFAHDLYSLAPLEQARVSIYSTKNQLLRRETTDERGMVHMKEFNAALGVPRVAVVEHGGDYTFLHLEPRREEAYQFDRAMPPYDREGYDAFLYADRQLYRPGETAHLRWIARKNYGDALAGVPLLLTIVKPNGQTLLSQPTIPSSLGTGGLDLETQKTYPTGRYQVRLAVPGSARAVGTYTFSLEEFVPNRIKATVTASTDKWLAGEDYEFCVAAQHLFGAPAEGRRCNAVVVFRREGWKPKDWKEFRFENDSKYLPRSVPCGEATTDKTGTATLSFRYNPPSQVTFPMTGEVIARVYESGGRMVTAQTRGTAFPSEVCLGVAAAPSRDKKGIEVFAAAIDPDENPAELEKVQITLERQIWNYYVRRYYGYYSPEWSESFQRIETREIGLVAGRASAVFPLDDYGYYRVRVHSAETRQYSTLSFYSCGGRCEILDAARPSLIKLTLDKESYRPGEEAVVRVESPFDGKGLIVVQGESIERMIPITIQNNVGQARLTVSRQHYPNVWIEATVIHGVQKGRKQVYPFSSFAAACLKVHDPQRVVTVSFPSLPVEIRPATKVQFEIDARLSNEMPAEAEVTLAAVDEGIHSITGYASPDPQAWLSRNRAPDCRQAHYYDRVAYEFEKPTAGGDAGEGPMARRLGAVGENWIKPVALWSGAVRTDKRGRATVTMEVPEFSGQLRLVAVACSEKAVGSCSRNLYVRRPYTLQVSVPRFLLPGDSVQCRATVFNRTNSPCKARVTWTFGGVIREGPGSREVDLAAQSESGIVVPFAAGNVVGQGEMRWEVAILDAAGREQERLSQALPIPVRPPAAYQSHQELVILKPSESRTFRNVRFLENDLAEVDLTVSANPLLRLKEALEYVVGYPYGCVEQTTSRLMPMYLLRKSGPFLKSVLREGDSLDGYIQAGINRLLAMQTLAGGLGVWPGDDRPYPYGSIYALHFLTLVANDREYNLPLQSLNALREYVRGLANDWTNNSLSGLYQRAYAVYVLALGGDLKAIQEIERFESLTLPRAARFLLAAALAVNTKDNDRVRLFLSNPSDPYAVRESDATLNSDIRNKAVELLTLRQMGGSAEQRLEKANELITFLDAHHYGSTQETAFIVTALAGYLSDFQTDVDAASATITTKGKETTIQKNDVYHGAQKGAGAEIRVANTGKTDLFVNVTTRGIPERVESAPTAKGVSVRRLFRTDQGDAASSSTFRQGNTYIVGLEITCDDTVKNLIAVDLLPAGLEVENPRLNVSSIPTKLLKSSLTPSYLDIRDDRVVLAFNEVSRGTHYYHYAVSAVTPGQYQHPPAVAECMYDASIRGTSAGWAITVQQGW